MRNPILKEENKLSVIEPQGDYTLRDKFASEALNGMMANRYTYSDDPVRIARNCYEVADAMLKERENEKN